LQLERNSHPSLYVFILRLIARKAFGAAPPGACAAGLKSLEIMKKEVFAVRVLWRKVSLALVRWGRKLISLTYPKFLSKGIFIFFHPSCMNALAFWTSCSGAPPVYSCLLATTPALFSLTMSKV
jgi:hypothetical protein